MKGQKPVRNPLKPANKNTIQDFLADSKIDSTFFSALSTPAVIYDDQKTIRMVNQAFSQLTGFKAKQLVGQIPPYPFWPPSKGIQYGRRLAGKKTLSNPLEMLDYKGQTIWVISRRIPLGKHAGGFIEIWSDVTAIVQKEQELTKSLKTSEYKFTKLFNAVPIPLAINTFPDLTFVDINRSFLKTSGFKRQDLIGAKTDSLPWTDRELVKYIKEKVRHNSQVSHKEINLVSKDGKPHTAIFYTRAVTLEGQAYTLSASLDITSRKQMEEALKDSESFNASLMKQSSNPILVLNSDGSIRYVNPAMEKLTGYTAKELVGRSSPFPWWPEGKAQTYSLRKKLLENGELIIRDRQYIDKNGKVFHISGTVRPIKEKGKIKYYLSNWTDVTERKQAELALRESEAFTSSLLDQAPNPILVMNLDNSIRYVNPALQKLTGFSRDELVGRHYPYPWWPPGQESIFIKNNAHDQRRGIRREIREYQDKNGERFWVEFSINPVKEKARVKYYLSTWLDITERKKAEKALQESEAFTSNILETAPNPIVVTKPDGSVFYVNPAAEKLTGYSRDELVGRGYPYPWWPSGALSTPEQDFLSGKIEEARLDNARFVNKTGQYFWVSAIIKPVYMDGEIKYFLRNWVDITERKKAEDALKEKEVYISSVLQDTPNPLLITDLENRVTYVNKALQTITGYTSQELVGLKPPYPWWQAQDHTQFIHEGEKGHSQEVNILERHYKTRRGEDLWVTLHIRRVIIGGKLIHFLTNWFDITERKKAEEALKASEAFNYSLLNDAPNLILVTNADHTIRFINRAFEKLTGYSSSELVGTGPPYLWWRPDKTHQYIQELQGNSHQELYAFEREGVSKAGKPFWLAVTIRRIIENGRINYSIANCVDITEQKKALEALKTSEAFNLSLMQNSPNPILVVNPDTSIRYVNTALESLTGFSLAEVAGTKPPYPWWSAPTDSALEFEQPVPAGQEVTNAEKILRKKNGQKFWISLSLRMVRDETGRLLYFIGNWTDITERKKAEEALKESENFNASLLDNAPNPILVVNPDTSIKYINPALQQLTGFSFEEAVGARPPYPWWLPFDSNSPEDEKPVMEHQTITGVEKRLGKKNGEIFWISLSLREVHEKGHLRYLIANWTDITERKKTEETLKAELIRRRLLIDQSSDGIVVLDSNGGVVETNLRFAEMIGYSADEVLHLHVWDWEYQVPYESLLNMIRTIDEKGDHFETKHRRKDGTTYDVEISTNGAQFGGQKLIFCVCRDITARKKAENALKESEAFNSNLLSNAPNPIMVNDIDSTVAYVNPAFEKLTGYSSSEILGLKVPYPWWPKEQISTYNQQNEEGRKQDIAILERNMVKKGGETFWVVESIHPVNESGITKFYLANWVDITERRKAEEAIRESEAFKTSLLNDAPNPVLVYNLDRTVRYVNPAAEQLTGFSNAELIGKGLPYPWWPPDQVAQYYSADEQTRNQEGYSVVERQIVTKGGERLWVNISFRTVKEQGRAKFYLANWQDITERKKIEEAIRESEAFNSSLLNDAPNPVLVYNLDDSVRYVNPATEQLTGYSSREMMEPNRHIHGGRRIKPNSF